MIFDRQNEPSNEQGIQRFEQKKGFVFLLTTENFYLNLMVAVRQLRTPSGRPEDQIFWT